MPLTVRPYQPSDKTPLLDRFADDARAPWLRLPPPYGVADLVGAKAWLTQLVVETAPGAALGMVAIDSRPQDGPLLLGPLLPDDQLADLLGKALVTAAVQAAQGAAAPALRVRSELGAERALTFFLNHGFVLLGTRQYVLAARKPPRAPVTPDGLRIAPASEMLTSDYQRLYTEIGAPLGVTERAGWTRPELFDHLQKPGIQLIGVRAGETWLGFAELAATGDGDAELSLYGILPAFRGRGIGAALVDHAIWHATTQLGAERVLLAATTDEGGQLGWEPSHRGFRQERALVFLERRLSVGAAPRD